MFSTNSKHGSTTLAYASGTRPAKTSDPDGAIAALTALPQPRGIAAPAPGAQLPPELGGFTDFGICAEVGRNGTLRTGQPSA